MLSAIDETPLTPLQKLRLFRLGICPRLSWPLIIEEFPITWLEHELEPLATNTLKRWVGVPRSSNTTVLFLPEKRGGLALPSLVSLHKKMQGTRMIQLLTSHDPGVRQAGDLQLAEERARQHLNFRPASLANSTICQNQHLSRKALKRGVQTIVQTEEVEERHKQLCQLPAQGEMARAWDENSPELWVRALQDLPQEPYKFVLAASSNTLPTNANLHMWGKKEK